MDRSHRSLQPLRRIVIQQNALRVAVGIVILPAGQRPQQNRQAEKPDQQREGNDQRHAGHRAFPAASRKALRVTSMDDPAMVAAAISGVTKPSAARGTAVRL